MARTHLTDHSGPIDYQSTIKKISQYFIEHDTVIETKKIVVHTFTMGDVEDPDLYAAEPLYQWQNSDQGKWVMENAMDIPEWNRMADPVSFGHKYYVTAVFKTKTLTEYYLRFGKTSP
jgi:hypothetical protein